MSDLRLAVRSATPVVSAVAVLSLALGIGANTAIFSLVNSLMLRALEVKEQARLALVKGRELNGGYLEWHYPTWEQIRERRALFDGVTAYSPTARANVPRQPRRAQRGNASAAAKPRRAARRLHAVVGQHSLTCCLLRTLCRLLQSRQSIGYSLVELSAPEMFEHPSPPSR